MNLLGYIAGKNIKILFFCPFDKVKQTWTFEDPVILVRSNKTNNNNVVPPQIPVRPWRPHPRRPDRLHRAHPDEGAPRHARLQRRLLVGGEEGPKHRLRQGLPGDLPS